jgi:predicted Zn-dependent protease
VQCVAGAILAQFDANYRGLLGVAENQSQMAAVMGHELGHMMARARFDPRQSVKLWENMARAAGL